MFVRFAPILFVLIWSTGWIVTKYVTPFADPLTFLSVRYVGAAALMVVMSLAAASKWPERPADYGHALMSGILLHGVYLGGVWWAIGAGLPVGISGLIAAVQPLLTALLARRTTGERLRPAQWLGVVVGFVGLVLAISPKFTGIGAATLSDFALPIAVNVLGMVGVTLGTIYQKRYLQTGGLRPMTALQYVGAFAVTLPVAWLVEPMRIEWVPEIFLGLAWCVFGLSFGAIMLLLMLIRQGAVSRAASLIYLIPPTVAVEAYFLYGETMSPVQILGGLITVIGVYLVSARQADAPPTRLSS